MDYQFAGNGLPVGLLLGSNPSCRSWESFNVHSSWELSPHLRFNRPFPPSIYVCGFKINVKHQKHLHKKPGTGSVAVSDSRAALRCTITNSYAARSSITELQFAVPRSVANSVAKHTFYRETKAVPLEL